MILHLLKKYHHTHFLILLYIRLSGCLPTKQFNVYINVNNE
jgi:hypothetical protein